MNDLSIPASVLPVFADVLTAAARIAPHAHVTPVMRSRSLDALAGCELHFKCEHLQRIGAFKFRGACNAVFALGDAQAARGVVTQSSGNHGAAIALACRLRGIAASVVVPEGAPAVKLAAIESHGARIVRCAPNMRARDAAAAVLLAETGGALIHPFDNNDVIAGQGTAALELLREAALDAVLVPVGGGGLLSGTAIAAQAMRAGIDVWGAEPTGAADAHASLRDDRCITDMTAQTVCDGLRGHLAPRTFAILRERANGILLVEDDATVRAMRLLWERLKVLVEPSAAVAFAAVLNHRERFAGRRVGIVLSGGNVDLDGLPSLFAMASPDR
ncbi:MAG: pyridoxal-phosphate dependent enzyme [Luteimonas sp.]